MQLALELARLILIGYVGFLILFVISLGVTLMEKPRCPRCDLPGVATPGDYYRCPKCEGLFDNEPADDFYDDPTLRIEREEERLARKRGRLE